MVAEHCIGRPQQAFFTHLLGGQGFSYTLLREEHIFPCLSYSLGISLTEKNLRSSIQTFYFLHERGNFWYVGLKIAQLHLLSRLTFEPSSP